MPFTEVPTTSLASSAALNRSSLFCLAVANLSLLSSLYMSASVLLLFLVIAICSVTILIVSALASSLTVS